MHSSPLRFMSTYTSVPLRIPSFSAPRSSQLAVTCTFSTTHRSPRNSVPSHCSHITRSDTTSFLISASNHSVPLQIPASHAHIDFALPSNSPHLSDIPVNKMHSKGKENKAAPIDSTTSPLQKIQAKAQPSQLPTPLTYLQRTFSRYYV